MATDNKDRVRRHRERQRAKGMREIRIWVPDVNAPGFAEEARRQSLAINASPDTAEVQQWIDGINAEMWDELPPVG